MKNISETIGKIGRGMRYWNPISRLTPELLTRRLDAFHAGQLSGAAMMWECIERRDDLLQGVIAKRKKSISRLKWEILTLDDSEEALREKEALEGFYDNLRVSNAYDGNESGGFGLLVKQMMDAVGKKYAVHEIIYDNVDGNLTANFRFIPLWFFDNTAGRLKFVANDGEKVELEDGGWMVSVGDGLMESCSIAYLFKHLPLKDWLVYCERNGMPGVKGVTNAVPGSREWEMAREAVENFGAEFHALMSRGTEIESIDLGARGELPYPRLVERMDRAMSALWRGSDLTTMSNAHGMGMTMQQEELNLLEEDDAKMISETLNEQVDRYVLKYLFGTTRPKAYVHLKPTSNKNLSRDLDMFSKLFEMGIPLSKREIRERFGLSLPQDESDRIVKG